MEKRNIYLTTTPPDEARDSYLSSLKECVQLKYEMIHTVDSLNRITRAAVYARYCSPLCNAAAMDGIAVIAERTHGASEKEPVQLKEGEDYLAADTGEPVIMPFDAVIMAEDLLVADENTVKIMTAAVPWQHIRPIGEDIVAGEMVLPGRHKIRPMDIGVLLSAGITVIEAAAIPEVAIYPTGTEMIEPGTEPEAGRIIESNSQMFAAMVTQAGGKPHRYPPLPDHYDTMKQQLSAAIDNYDMIIINAGSSAGRKDYTVHVLRELGEVLIHGVAIKPGKPVILAIVKNKPVIGLPGYPVSAYIGFENFAAPVLAFLSGMPQTGPKRVEAVISKRLVSSLKHKEYVRVKVGRVGERLVAAPLARGAGAAMSLVRADGFCIIEQNQEGVDAGEQVSVELSRDMTAIENTLMITGSHDLILDVLADMIPHYYQGMSISSTHVGSMAGLMALFRGEAHLAPIHLLDEKTGNYNVDYLKTMAKEPMALIRGVGRIQGLMVKAGNPRHIKSLGDLPQGTFINRQRGSGTRILLDFKLRELGIAAGDIIGYDREAATHMAVAAAVRNDSADAGMGIMAAAKALGLDFVELYAEQYDFALPAVSLESAGIRQFIQMIQSRPFKQRLDELGGYRYDRTGEVVLI